MYGLTAINRMNNMSNQERQEHNLELDRQAEAKEKAEELRLTFWTIVGVFLIIVSAALTVI